MLTASKEYSGELGVRALNEDDPDSSSNALGELFNYIGFEWLQLIRFTPNSFVFPLERSLIVFSYSDSPDAWASGLFCFLNNQFLTDRRLRSDTPDKRCRSLRPTKKERKNLVVCRKSCTFGQTVVYDGQQENPQTENGIINFRHLQWQWKQKIWKTGAIVITGSL